MSAASFLEALAECQADEKAVRSAKARAVIGSAVASLGRCGSGELAENGTALAQSAQDFRRTLHRNQEALLDNALQWTDEDRAFAQWAAHTTWRWSTAAGTAAEASAGSDAAAALIGATLCMAGDSVKWHAIAAIACPKGLHARANRTLCLADELGLGGSEITCEADGVSLTRQAQHLYARALLLDFLASGNLTRQQVEIADAWVSRWSRDYTMSRTPPASGTALWVDLSGHMGLRAGARPQGNDLRFLVLESLPRQLATIERGFHGGRIFPGAGVSVKFRVEEHVVVLDNLHRLVAQLRAKSPARRAERNLADGVTVEVFVGVREIVERALHDAPGGSSPNAAALELVADPGEPRRDAYESPRHIEVEHRWMRRVDVSEGGMGLLAERGEHEDLCVGDLVAISEGDALAVGEITRRSPQGTTGDLFGVAVSSRSARAARLQRVADPNNRRPRALDAVFVPGVDACGRGDALVVNEGSYDPRARYELAFDDCVFVIALNRVRRQGRGWLSCGYEVLEQRQKAA